MRFFAFILALALFTPCLAAGAKHAASEELVFSTDNASTCDATANYVLDTAHEEPIVDCKETSTRFSRVFEPIFYVVDHPLTRAAIQFFDIRYVSRNVFYKLRGAVAEVYNGFRAIAAGQWHRPGLSETLVTTEDRSEHETSYEEDTDLANIVYAGYGECLPLSWRHFFYELDRMSSAGQSLRHHGAAFYNDRIWSTTKLSNGPANLPLENAHFTFVTWAIIIFGYVRWRGRIAQGLKSCFRVSVLVAVKGIQQLDRGSALEQIPNSLHGIRHCSQLQTAYQPVVLSFNGLTQAFASLDAAVCALESSEHDSVSFDAAPARFPATMCVLEGQEDSEEESSEYFTALTSLDTVETPIEIASSDLTSEWSPASVSSESALTVPAFEEESCGSLDGSASSNESDCCSVYSLEWLASRFESDSSSTNSSFADLGVGSLAEPATPLSINEVTPPEDKLPSSSETRQCFFDLPEDLQSLMLRTFTAGVCDYDHLAFRYQFIYAHSLESARRKIDVTSIEDLASYVQQNLPLVLKVSKTILWCDASCQDFMGGLDCLISLEERYTDIHERTAASIKESMQSLNTKCSMVVERRVGVPYGRLVSDGIEVSSLLDAAGRLRLKDRLKQSTKIRHTAEAIEKFLALRGSLNVDIAELTMNVLSQYQQCVESNRMNIKTNPRILQDFLKAVNG